MGIKNNSQFAFYISHSILHFTIYILHLVKSNKKIKYILLAVGLLLPVLFTWLKSLSDYFLLVYVPFNPFAIYAGALVSKLKLGEVVISGMMYFLFGYLIETFTLKKFLTTILPIFFILGILVLLLVIKMYSFLGRPEYIMDVLSVFGNM